MNGKPHGLRITGWWAGLIIIVIILGIIDVIERMVRVVF